MSEHVPSLAPLPEDNHIEYTIVVFDPSRPYVRLNGYGRHTEPPFANAPKYCADAYVRVGFGAARDRFYCSAAFAHQGDAVLDATSAIRDHAAKQLHAALHHEEI